MKFKSFKAIVLSSLIVTATLWVHDAEATKGNEPDKQVKLKRDRNESDVPQEDQKERDENPAALKKMHTGIAPDSQDEDVGNLEPMDIASEDEEGESQVLPAFKIPVFEQLTVKQQQDLIARANGGNQAAQDEVIYLFYHKMIPSLKTSDINVEAWASLKKKVEKDDIHAFFVLTVFTSDDLKATFQNLLTQLKKRADEGHAPAQYNLGGVYWVGKGIPQDREKAVEWIEKAALQGHAYAQNNLGVALWSRECILQDHVKAIKWFERAALQGHSQAQYNMGAAYIRGKGVPQDLEKAIECFFHAARQKHHQASHTFTQLFSFQPTASLEDGESHDLLKMSTLMGSMTSNHEFKSIVNNSNGRWKDCDFAIPELIPMYQKAVEVEDELFIQLSALAHVKPGFMVTCVKATQKVQAHLANQTQTSFIDIYCLGDDEYVTWGHENVETAREFIKFLRGMKKKVKHADQQLEKILFCLQPLNGLLAAQSVALQSEKGKEWFLEEQKRYEEIRKANAPQIELIENQRAQLAEAKELLLNYIPKAVGARNKAFLKSEEFGFYKKM